MSVDDRQTCSGGVPIELQAVLDRNVGSPQCVYLDSDDDEKATCPVCQAYVGYTAGRYSGNYIYPPFWTISHESREGQG